MKYAITMTQLNGKIIYGIPDLGVMIDSKSLNATVLDAFEDLRNKRKRIPFPEANGSDYVKLNIITAAKMALHNALVDRNMSYKELCALLKISPTQVTRITSFLHNSKIEELEKALEALGYTLELDVF